MSDICVLIGKQLRYGVEQCGKGSFVVDLSGYTLEEIRNPIVTGMIQEFKQLYVFRINSDTREVTVVWSPESMRGNRVDRSTARYMRRRQG